MKKFYLSLAMLACFAASLAFVHAASAAAITLSATVNTSGAQPSVVLQWTDLGRDTRYDVYRDYQKECSQTTNTLTDTPTGTGQTHDYCIYATGGRGQAMVVSNHVTVNFSSGVVSAPTGLSAEPMWVASCPLCNGMAMAHIVLTWTPVPSATAYNVFRNGTLLQSNLSTPTDTDMTVVSGQQYTYAVSAVTPSGLTPQSAPATATAPDPPMPAGFTAPTNLAVNSAWAGGPVDTLTWDAVPGAASYNIYQYNKLVAKGIVGTSYTVPTNVYNASMTYTVTAVDADCSCESIPSNPAGAGGIADPNNLPTWDSNWICAAPTSVTTSAEWNGGAPRIHVTWVDNSGDAQTYNIYRDGIEIASGLWGMSWFDNNVRPGEQHTYAVSGVNTWWPGSVEGVLSASASATSLIAAPAQVAGGVHIVSVQPDDDSARVFFNTVPGAADYRVYDVSNPGSVKYCGWYGTGQSSDMIKNGYPALAPPTEMSIQWNGIDPTKGANLVVEAVDKLGPFQTMDGSLGPGAMEMNGMSNDSINGQGDPSNVPNVIARSDVFHVDCQPFALTGSQAFFDNFRNSTPFTAVPVDPVVAAAGSSYFEVNEADNDKWRIQTFGADTDMSRAFVMSNHFMDTLYDGPTAATTPFSHNNNASLVMIPKATGDISGGKVLHVTFEVDAHFDTRRWVDVFVGEAGDPLIQSAPTKLTANELPTVKGNLFVWQMEGPHDVELVTPQPQSNGTVQNQITDLMQFSNWNDGETMDRGIYSQVFGFYKTYANGSPQNLDSRSRFDLYLSTNHYRIVETEPDGTQLIRDHDFPAGVTLPFTNCQVYFVHEVYHTGNDRPEQEGDVNGRYWYNYRPWGDERHWDNMGFEVLSSFPK